MQTKLWLGFCFFAAALVLGCSPKPAELVELKRFSIDSLESVITRSDLSFDSAVSSDGGGSLRVAVSQPTVIRLFEVEVRDVEAARLIYRAKLRTQHVQGQAFIEMWCRFPGKGEFFSRALNSPLTGTNEWTTQETPFVLQKGEKPDLVKLNLVINGSGTVWIDDVVLLRAGL